MPKYKELPGSSNIPVEDDFRKMLGKARDEDEKRLLLTLWLTGARPGEFLMVKGKDCAPNEKTLRMRVPTEKLHGTGQFQIRERVLEWERVNEWVELLIPLLPTTPEAFLIWNERGDRTLATLERRAQRIINKLTLEVMGIELSPYHFRHGLLTNMGEAKNESGAYIYNVYDLKAWKGAKTVKSVEGYIHSRSPLMNMGAINRTRKLD